MDRARGIRVSSVMTILCYSLVAVIVSVGAVPLAAQAISRLARWFAAPFPFID
jgi:hypothetical protein